MTDGIALGRASIQRHSKSFALAARLLPERVRNDASVVYAWCRQADDAVDETQGASQRQALECSRRGLMAVYGGAELDDPLLAALRDVIERRAIPLEYPSELLLGMEMDARGQRYESLDELLVYCHRVASTVGLMMCHVMGVSHPVALRHAAHLGLAMQLTNICRDVREDWQRGRLYLPRDVLSRHGAAELWDVPRPAELPAALARAGRGALRDLLGAAERYYASADRGLRYLSFRSAIAVGVARRVYSAIGTEIARRGHDVTAPRAVVPARRKALLAAAAATATTMARVWRPQRFTAVPLQGLPHVTTDFTPL